MPVCSAHGARVSLSNVSILAFISRRVLAVLADRKKEREGGRVVVDAAFSVSQCSFSNVLGVCSFSTLFFFFFGVLLLVLLF